MFQYMKHIVILQNKVDMYNISIKIKDAIRKAISLLGAKLSSQYTYIHLQLGHQFPGL